MPSLLESRNCLLHLWTFLCWKRIQPQFWPMTTGCSLNPAPRYFKKGDIVVLGKAKLRYKKSISWPQCAEEMSPKKNFKGIHDRFQRDSTYRDSQLQIGWTEEKCIEMDKFAQEPLVLPIFWGVREKREKLAMSHWTNQAEMHRSNSDQTSEKHQQICTVATVNLEKSDLYKFLSINTKNGIRRPLHPVLHVEWKLMVVELVICVWICFSKMFTADDKLLQPTEGVNRTPHTSHFLAFARTHDSVARDIGSRLLSASRHPCFMRSVCSDPSSTLHFALFTVSLIFSFSWSSSSSSSSMWVASERSTLCASRMRS